jgi:hypothetical protein
LSHVIVKRETPFSREEYGAMALGDEVHFMPKVTQRASPLARSQRMGKHAIFITGEIRRPHRLAYAAGA